MKMERSCRMPSMFWVFPVCLILCVIIFGEVDSIKISASYPIGASDPVKWRNLAIDPVTRKVYAGAVNRLFSFDENLAVTESTQTGPVLDNPECYDKLGENPCLNANAKEFQSSMTDNSNQILVVDQKHQQLVTCGNVYQGTCETRSLTNISLSMNYSSPLSQYVVVASRTYPTVAFVGPGPFGDDVLYDGTGYPGKTTAEWYLAKYLAGVSSRNLTGPGTFLVAEDDRTTQTYGTRAFLTQEAAMKYRINYVAGFTLNGFSYFLTTQPEPFNLPIVSEVITSKLVQVCQGDKYFDSYVDTRIICKSGGVDYNLIQAAAFIQPGTTLARELGLTVNDYVLLGLLSTSSQSNFGSAVCIYPLSYIRRTFKQNIRKCYKSSRDQPLVGPQFAGSNRPCQASIMVSINDSYCGSIFRSSMEPNSPLVGSIPLISSRPALVLQGVNVTAVKAATLDNHTVLFMGTSDGKLIKALLGSTAGDPYERSEVGRSAVNQDLLFDADKSHLYLMTSETIFKIPVSDCPQCVTCDQCLAAKDPYCGWCTLEKSCRKSSECADMQLANRWLSIYSESQAVCPTIDSTPSNADITRDLSDGCQTTITFPESSVSTINYLDIKDISMLSDIEMVTSVTTALPDGMGIGSSSNFWCREGPGHASSLASLDRPMSDEYEIMPYAYNTDAYDKIDDIIETDLNFPIQFPRREEPLPTPGYDSLLLRPSTPTVYSSIDNYEQPVDSEDIGIEISPGHIPECEQYSDIIEHGVNVNEIHPAYIQLIGDEQSMDIENIEKRPDHTPESEQFSDMDKSFAIEHGVKVNEKHPAYLQLINDEQPMSCEKIERNPGHTPEAGQYSDTIKHSVNVNAKDPAYIPLISEGEDSSITLSTVSRKEINRSSMTSSNSVEEIVSSYLKINEDATKDDSSEEIPSSYLKITDDATKVIP